MGPLMLDVAGYELDAEDREIIQHPTVGGIIFFARNYHDREQLRALTKDIRNTAKRPLLIADIFGQGAKISAIRRGRLAVLLSIRKVAVSSASVKNLHYFHQPKLLPKVMKGNL